MIRPEQLKKYTGTNERTVKKKKIYKEVRQRDHYRCIACDKIVDDLVPPHHVVYKRKGGKDSVDNLVTLCIKCHNNLHRKRGDYQYILFRCVDHLAKLYGR